MNKIKKRGNDMKKTLSIITAVIFAFGSVLYAQEKAVKSEDKVKLMEEAKVKSGDRIQAKDQVRLKEQAKIKDGDKGTDGKGEKERNAIKNSGDDKKVKAQNRERNRDKRALKKESKEQKKEMRENRKILQDMNKGKKGGRQ